MVGETIDGRYRVLRIIGEGGMGAVYEARHVGTGRRVAVKVIRSPLSEKAETVLRFQREVRLAGSIETPHIVQVLDTGTDPATGVTYMVMEFLEGEDLQQLLKRHGRLSPSLALRLVGQACLGLGKAHQAGVVHRDIKPANLFLSRMESGPVIVKVVDFGIAKTIDVAGEDASLTSTGGLVGSPLYVSPEQAMGRKTIDHRSDVWSLGVVLYQALAGRPPRPKSDTVVALMMGICTEPAPPIQDFAPWVPPEIARLVHRMLVIDPNARIQSVGQVLDTISAWMPQGLAVDARELVPLSPTVEAQVAERAVLDTETITVRVSGPPRDAPSINPRAGDLGADAAPPSAAVLEVPTPAGETALSISQTAAEAVFRRRRPWLRPLVGLAAVLASVGVAVYALHDGGAAPAGHDGGDAQTAAAASTSASAPADPPPAPTPEEHTARLAVDPPDATVTVDGQVAPVEAGGIALRGPLGSVHHVHVAKGAQAVDGDIAITSLGAVPSRLRVESAAPRSTGRSAGAPPGKPRKPAPDRKFE